MPSLPRRRFLATTAATVSGTTLGSLWASEAPDVDVLVYGATPAGICAAIAAASRGCRVLLVEPTRRIGGMTTCGLSHTDLRSFESLSGLALQFFGRVERHYRTQYGDGSAQWKDCFRGTQAEPKVNLQVFEAMLGEYPNITVQRETFLERAETQGSGSRTRIHAVELRNGSGTASRVTARVFVDATYEGDLMAAAGVPFRIGREGRDEFGETLAPALPDGELQGYNFRICATREPANRVAPTQPEGYRREDYLDVLPLFATGRLRQIFGMKPDTVFKAQIPVLPNGKYDLNDVSHSAVRLSLPGENLEWPNGSAEQRARIFAEHLRWSTGLLWFFQNDKAVPAPLQQEAREWGWCKDEFTDSDHLPPQLYVREARRMVGLRIYTQRDSMHAAGDARAVLHTDSIAMGDYGNNCHGTGHTGPRAGGKHSGEFYNHVPPYQIPYATLLPREHRNLLVPGAMSASHVGFCALRLEPIWMALGEAAGLAAAAAAQNGVAVQAVPPEALQQRLWRRGSATVYVSDVLPSSPDFAAVQWWGTRGGLHGLAPTPAADALWGKNIVGQYFEAFPGHLAELSMPLDKALLERWTALAKQAGIDLPATQGDTTRGDFIRQAFRAWRRNG